MRVVSPRAFSQLALQNQSLLCISASVSDGAPFLTASQPTWQ